MDMEGAEAKSAFGGSNKRARTAAGGSEWAQSQVFSDDQAEADVRSRAGSATLPSAATRKAKSAGEPLFPMLIMHDVACQLCPQANPASYG